MSSSLGMMTFPYIMENKKCLKPPTRLPRINSGVNSLILKDTTWLQQVTTLNSQRRNPNTSKSLAPHHLVISTAQNIEIGDIQLCNSGLCFDYITDIIVLTCVHIVQMGLLQAASKYNIVDS